MKRKERSTLSNLRTASRAKHKKPAKLCTIIATQELIQD